MCLDIVKELEGGYRYECLIRKLACTGTLVTASELRSLPQIEGDGSCNSCIRRLLGMRPFRTARNSRMW